MINISNDITKSKTLPGAFYSSEEMFKLSLEKIFTRNWQFITDDTVIQKEGSVYPFKFLDDVVPEPLFLINNKNIECYSNVCTHRGNILINKAGEIKNLITCGYHGRQFNHCGKFKFMPKTEGMQDFPSDIEDLQKLHVGKWKQFIFTNLEPNFSFDQLVKDMEERVGWMPVNEFHYREDLSKEYTVNANWALYCDNYLEGFHIPFVHNDLNNVLEFENYKVELFKYSNLQIGIAKDKEICFDLPKDSKDYGKKIAAYYFWLFPNIMFNFYPWGLSLNIVKPISKTETKIQFKSYVWDEEKLQKGAGADLHKVELEDEEIVENVQKGVVSRFYKHGRFSPSMEQGVHHFHTLISKFMNL